MGGHRKRANCGASSIAVSAASAAGQVACAHPVFTSVAVGTLAAPVAVPAALGILGFSATGVVAGTTAAAIQASIGNVAAGSLFAAAQSVAAAGISWTTAAVVGAGTGAAVKAAQAAVS